MSEGIRREAEILLGDDPRDTYLKPIEGEDDSRDPYWAPESVEERKKERREEREQSKAADLAIEPENFSEGEGFLSPRGSFQKATPLSPEPELSVSVAYEPEAEPEPKPIDKKDAVLPNSAPELVVKKGTKKETEKEKEAREKKEGEKAAQLEAEKLDIEEDEFSVEEGVVELPSPYQGAIDALHAVVAAMDVLMNPSEAQDLIRGLEVKEKLIAQEMDKVRNEMMMKDHFDPEVQGYGRLYKAADDKFQRNTQQAVENRLSQQGYRTKIAHIVHDKTAEIGSALETILNIFSPEKNLVKSAGGYVVLPGVVSQVELQLRLARNKIVPNIEESRIGEISSRFTTSDDMFILGKKRTAAADKNGLYDFVAEDLKLLGHALADTALTSFITVPQIRLVEAVREAIEALQNEESPLRKMGLGVNVLTQTLCGLLNTMVGIPEVWLKASAAFDTRIFYFATGLLKGRSDLVHSDHELFDRVNWVVKNICCDNKYVARLLGLLIGAGYFMTTFPAKQIVQLELSIPLNTVKIATKLASALFSFRSFGFTAKELIQAVATVGELLPALLVPSNMFTSSFAKDFASQARAFPSIASIDPKNWSRIHHLFNSNTPVSLTYQGWKNYQAHGWSAWVAQFLGASIARSAKLIEKPFNERAKKSWEKESRARADREITAIVEIYRERHQRYAALKRALDNCREEISKLRGLEVAIDLDVKRNSQPNTSDAEAERGDIKEHKSAQDTDGSSPLDEERDESQLPPSSASFASPHYVQADSSSSSAPMITTSSGPLTTSAQLPEAPALVSEESDDQDRVVRIGDIKLTKSDVLEQARASFNQLSKPDAVNKFVSTLGSNEKKIEELLSFLEPLAKLSGVTFNQYEKSMPIVRVENLKNEYRQLYDGFDVQKVANMQFEKIASSKEADYKPKVDPSIVTSSSVVRFKFGGGKGSSLAEHEKMLPQGDIELATSPRSLSPVPAGDDIV